MLELILIIALFIAIIFDCIRIAQYIAMRKVLDEKNKSDIAHKIDILYDEWAHSVEDIDTTVGQYCMKHWHDKLG